jgi:hypothetical protein
MHLDSVAFAGFAAAAFVLSRMVAHSDLTLPRVIAVLAASQVFLHYLMQATMTAMPPAAGSVPMASHDLVSAGSTVAPVSLLDAAGPMFTAHAIAIAISALLVLQGDRLLSGLEALLTYLVPALPKPVAAPNRDVWTRLPVYTSNWVPAMRLRTTSHSRRGPPARWVPTPPAFAQDQLT